MARTFPAMDQMAGPSDPTPLQSSSNDLRRRMRMLYESENARAILLAVGIVAFFALASLYSENRDEHQTAVPACDSDSCSDAFANVPPATSTPEETPTVGRVHSDDPDHQPAPAAEPHRKPARIAKSNPPGIVVSRKTGARARVGIAHAARFQAYIDDLENNHGARILFMGGTRPGRCSSSGMHPCGKALDVCQMRRGVVDPRCHLPPRRALAQIASSHGLFEGGRWCNSDYGHVQLGVTAGDCGDRRTRIVRRTMAPETRREAAAASFE
jgi:hypothetical protein